MLQIDFIAIFMWGIIAFGIVLIISITYNIAKKMLTSQPSTQQKLSAVKEYFITIDINDAMLSYNLAKNNFDGMDYKSSIMNCYMAVKDVLTKILNYIHIPFSQDLNIVDMSFLALSKGVRVSFIEATQHINSIRLRLILDQPVSKDEVLWTLSASKTIIDTCKELPITVF